MMRFWMLTIFAGLMNIAMAQEGSSSGVDAVDDSAFAKANSSYTSENYQEAIDSYEAILQSGQHSAEVYFNLANAYYKINKIGPSIYNYEKALQLDPNSKEIKNNLKFAQQLRVDKIEKTEVNPLIDFVAGVFKSLSIDNWAYLSIILALIAILMFIFYHYAATAGKKRLFFIASLVFLLATIFTIVAAAYSQNWKENNQEAIVYSTETITRTEPKSTAESSFAIHEGTKVTIIAEYQDWAQITLANGSKSWMPLADLKKL